MKIAMSIFVDDLLCAVKKEDLEWLYKDLWKKYKITTLGKVTKYLGVNFK